MNAHAAWAHFKGWLAFLIFSPVLCLAQPAAIQRRAVLEAAQAVPIVAGGGAGISYSISNNFEEVGTPSGFTVNGTVSFDATVSPLEGSESFTNAGASGYAWKALAASTNEAWGYTIINPFNNPADNEAGFFEFWASGFGSRPLTVAYDTAGTSPLKVGSGGASAVTVSTVAAGTTVHVWIHYLKGPGAGDDTAEVWFSTDGTKPADGSNNHAKVTTGDTDGSVGLVLIGSDGTGPSQKIDKLRVAGVAIGSNPQ